MLYQFCKKNSCDYLELDFDDRHEVTHWVENHMDEIQKFSVYESGHIFGYAVELSDKNEKPIAILYPHKVAQLIWIDMD